MPGGIFTIGTIFIVVGIATVLCIKFIVPMLKGHPNIPTTPQLASEDPGYVSSKDEMWAACDFTGQRVLGDVSEAPECECEEEVMSQRVTSKPFHGEVITSGKYYFLSRCHSATITGMLFVGVQSLCHMHIHGSEVSFIFVIN